VGKVNRPPVRVPGATRYLYSVSLFVNATVDGGYRATTRAVYAPGVLVPPTFFFHTVAAASLIL